MSLQPSAAIVTGSDSGIGRATAVALAAAGMDIGLTRHTDHDGARRTAREVEQHNPRSFAARLDTAEPAGDAREFASVIAFLASPAAAYVTGASWVVDGGSVSRRRWPPRRLRDRASERSTVIRRQHCRPRSPKGGGWVTREIHPSRPDRFNQEPVGLPVSAGHSAQRRWWPAFGTTRDGAGSCLSLAPPEPAGRSVLGPDAAFGAGKDDADAVAVAVVGAASTMPVIAPVGAWNRIAWPAGPLSIAAP